MKKLILTFYFLVGLTYAQGQEQRNIEDLDSLYKRIQQTYSYKDQLKNDPSYAELYQKLRKELNIADEFIVYQKLVQLIYPLKDNHLGFYHALDTVNKYPFQTPKADLKTLEKRLSNAPKDSLEGVYYDNNGNNSYILYKKEPNIYYLQALGTGFLQAILTRNKFNSFDAIQFFNSMYAYQLCRNVRFINQSLIGLPYKKSKQKDYRSIGKVDSYFEYKNLNEKTGYLRLSTFNPTETNIKNATEFFERVKSQINGQNLIVDIRNNSGGGFKISGQFIDFLWKYGGNIYILQNAYSMSNAEQFVINVRLRKKITVLGEPTRGTITYGSNYGLNILLPSKRFAFYPTDMKGTARDLAYESIGVVPDIYLDAYGNDWITQTLSYIK